MLFTRVMSVAALPPGKYVLRAVLTKGGQPLKTMTRAFELAMTTIPASAAASGDGPSTDGELFLPIGDAALAGSFQLEEALEPETMKPFLAHLAPAGKDAFDKGVASAAAHEYPKAEASFKAAVRPEAETHGAARVPRRGLRRVRARRRSRERVADGARRRREIPQIYQWLADALMRSSDLGAARSILEEAVGKWPADSRFARPLALLYASFGRGRDAVKMLERYIADARPP